MATIDLSAERHGWSASLERQCLEFEDRLRAGDTPRIDDYVTAVDEPWQTLLFEELFGLELAYQLRQGKLAELDTYVARFPDRTEVVRRVYREERERHEPRQIAPLPRPGRYRLERELGRGGYGVVWLADDAELGRKVAIKEMHPSLADEPIYLARFRREASLAGRLHHERIVQVLDYGIARTPFIVFNYVDGPDLAKACRAKRPSVDQAVRWVRDAAEGIAFAHSQCVLHRDVKPSNLLLTPDDRVVVSDFGLAKHRQGAAFSQDIRTQANANVGTREYMAPEQSAGGGDERSDVYGLGATLYHVLTGGPPLPSDVTVPKEGAPLHAGRSPRAVNAAVPRELDAICQRAMAFDPAARYATVDEFILDLDRFRDGRPLAPESRRFVRAASAIVPRVRRATTIALVAVLLLAAFTVGRFFAAAFATPLRTVVIDVAPEPSRVVFIPWSIDRDEPDLERQVRAERLASGEYAADLPPGFYLVEAVRADGRGFHQVFRTVPEKDEIGNPIYRHLSWSIGEGDAVELPSMTIRDREQVLRDQELRFVEAGEATLQAAPAPRAVDSFWLGTYEVGDSEFHGFGDENAAILPRTDDLPVDKLRWDDAVAYAERVGGRLPSEAEFALVEQRFYDGGTRYGPTPNSGAKLVAIGADQKHAAAHGGFVHLIDNASEWSRSALMSVDPEWFKQIPTTQQAFFRENFSIRGGMGDRMRQHDVLPEFTTVGSRFALPRGTPAVGLGMRVALSHAPYTSE